MGIAAKLRKMVGMEITKTQRVLNAEQAVRDIKKHRGKLPTKAGAPKKKAKKKKASKKSNGY